MPKIKKAFLIDSFLVNIIIIPSPELTNKPPNNAPKERFPSINNSDKSTLLAQLGIKPISDPNKGDK